MSKRTVATEPDSAVSPDPVAPVVHAPLATELVAHDEVAADALAVQEARAFLAPYLAKAEAQLPAYREVWAEAAPVVKRAMAENLTTLAARGLPDMALSRFRMVLAWISGLGEDIRRVEARIQASKELSGPLCRRTSWMRAAGQWPMAVQSIRDATLMVNEPAQQKRDKLDALRREHADLIGLAQGLSPTGPPLTAREPIRPESSGSVLAFDPFRTP